MFREVKVSGVVMDPQTKTPIVILKDLTEDTALPIWIGLLEATAIATELENVQFPRPMTHDLIKNCFVQLKVRVERVEVCDLKDNTYFATIHLQQDGQQKPVDARPSDAIAIALRMGAPIFVKEEVLVKYHNSEQSSKPVFAKGNEENWSEILENLDPKDYSKYKM
jgi:hypothetical protein